MLYPVCNIQCVMSTSVVPNYELFDIYFLQSRIRSRTRPATLVTFNRWPSFDRWRCFHRPERCGRAINSPDIARGGRVLIDGPVYPGDISADVINSPDMARGSRVVIDGAVYPGNISADVINSPDIARGSRVVIDGAVYPDNISAGAINSTFIIILVVKF